MRVKNAFRNSAFSVFSQVIFILVGFFSQRTMNLRMGEELVGMNSVISNIIALLSVSELGISTAVVFHLYGALAEGDEERISSLMNMYRRAYYVFATVITLLGLLVLPFVHLFLKENSFSLGYVRMIYGLWLLRTVLSYLLSYKRSILIADQKEFIVTIGVLVANVLNYSSIIVILELFQNYQLALGLNILIEVVINLVICGVVDRRYPYLKTFRHAPLEKGMVRRVVGDIKNIFATKLSSKLLISTDSLIMSGFISVAMVGLYSNYCMITRSLISIMEALSNALQPTVGSMFMEQDHEKEHGVLQQITFIFFLFASFASTSLLALMTPFVADIWLSREYMLNAWIVLGCVVNFFMYTMMQPLNMMMGVTGLFRKERNISVLAAGVNLVISLALVTPLGVIGVQLGTLAAHLVQIILRMSTLVRQYMGRRCGTYLAQWLQYILLTVVETGGVYYICSRIYVPGSLGHFVLLGIICVVVPNGLNLLLYHRTWRFRSIVGMLRQMLKHGMETSEEKE